MNREDPREEPCGCAWGSADTPFERDPGDHTKIAPDYNPDEKLRQFTECLECGATWTTEQDNAWVSAGVR
jgi:hypothetical protein